jgi:hypothetical protein
MSQYNFPKTKNTIDTLYRAYKNIQVSTNSIKTVFSKFIEKYSDISQFHKNSIFQVHTKYLIYMQVFSLLFEFAKSSR